MIYKLDGVDIETYGVFPVKAAGECIALSGLFDLPKRIGTTEFNWGTGYEAFVEEEDIELDGRVLTLNACIHNGDIEAVKAYVNACVTCRRLYTEFGEFDVICRDVVQVSSSAGGRLVSIQSKFYQNNIVIPELSITQPTGNSWGIEIDGYSLERCFGVYISETKKLDETGKRIEINTTLPYTQNQYREPVEITLNCQMLGEDLFALNKKMGQLHALCVAPGLRTLDAGNRTLKLYFKNGISVKVLNEKILRFDLKCRVAEWEN